MVYEKSSYCALSPGRLTCYKSHYFLVVICDCLRFFLYCLYFPLFLYLRHKLNYNAKQNRIRVGTNKQTLVCSLYDLWQCRQVIWEQHLWFHCSPLRFCVYRCCVYVLTNFAELTVSVRSWLHPGMLSSCHL